MRFLAQKLPIFAPVAAIASTLHAEKENIIINDRLGSRIEAPIAVSNKHQASAAESGSNRLQMIEGRVDFGIGRLMLCAVHAQSLMDIEGIAKELIIVTRKGLGERLIHGPGGGIVE